MSTPLTQDSLTFLLESRGWRVTDLRGESKKLPEDMHKGIAMWAASPTGYILSLQAGAANYCNPKAYAEQYESLEFAVWKHGPDGKKDGPYVRDRTITGNDDVVGWADWDKIMQTIHTIESWTNGRGPSMGIERSEAPWALDD